MTLPFSASADRNKQAIGDALEPWFNGISTVVEIGSGTGQHAVYLSARFPALQWWPTDRQENLAAIRERVSGSSTSNIARPFELDVSGVVQAPVEQFDRAYSANTAHIMRLREVEQMFGVVGELLAVDGIFALYGPFHYDGIHTAPSNAEFDHMLRQQAPHMGVRDKNSLDSYALAAGLDSLDDIEMPGNNRLLLWQRRST